MPRFHSPTFDRAELYELLNIVSAYKARGMQFVQLCATVVDDSCDLLYAFKDPQADVPGLKGITINVPSGAKVPSITGFYPAAFVFENETHDLFGVQIEGISIDFGGEFYTVAEKYPMNPDEAQREAQAQAQSREAAENVEHLHEEDRDDEQIDYDALAKDVQAAQDAQEV